MQSIKIISPLIKDIELTPIKYLFQHEFKSYLNRLVKICPIANDFKPRLYTYSDYIMPKLLSLITKHSLSFTAEALNQYAIFILHKKKKVLPKRFADNKRSRRLVPHQTDIDKFFRKLSELEVMTIFGGIIDYLNQKIIKEYLPGRTWIFAVDNTKYPYYGTRIDPKKHIRAKGLPGTSVAWFFQEYMIHSQDINLITSIRSLTKGVYRSKDIPGEVSWMEFMGTRIKVVLADREFYRVRLIDDLRKQHDSIIIPAKRYLWELRQLLRYLVLNGPLIVGNVISQSAKQYPFQASAYANFVICGKNGENPWDIREKFLNNQMSLSEALSRLAGFYTTLKVWKNRKNFYHYVVKTYKKRWNIESGIRDMNKIHETSRARKYTTKLAGLLLRAFIYNLWQFWREARANAGYRKASSTQAIFLEVLKHIVSKAYISDIVSRF